MKRTFLFVAASMLLAGICAFADEATVIPEQIGRYINKDEAEIVKSIYADFLCTGLSDLCIPVWCDWFYSDKGRRH